MTTATAFLSPPGASLISPRSARVSASHVAGGHRVESGQLEGRQRAGPGDPQRLRVLSQQRVELPLPQPVVERDQRHSRPGGREQRDREGRTVDIKVDEGVGRVLADQRGPRVGAPGKLGGGDPAGPAPGHDAGAESVSGHVKQQGQAHG